MDLGDVFSVLFIASVKAESMRMWYELHHGLQLGNATFLTVSSSRVPSDRGHSEPLYLCIISLYIYMTTTYYLIQYHHKICSCSTNKKNTRTVGDGVDSSWITDANSTPLWFSCTWIGMVQSWQQNHKTTSSLLLYIISPLAMANFTLPCKQVDAYICTYIYNTYSNYFGAGHNIEPFVHQQMQITISQPYNVCI